MHKVYLHGAHLHTQGVNSWSVSFAAQQSSFCIDSISLLQVAQDFKSTDGTFQPRELTAILSPHITFLVECRPLNMSMKNAIKHLKLKISQIEPGISLQEGKSIVGEMIRKYMHERITDATRALAQHAVEKVATLQICDMTLKVDVHSVNTHFLSLFSSYCGLSLVPPSCPSIQQPFLEPTIVWPTKTWFEQRGCLLLYLPIESMHVRKVCR